MPAFRSDRGSSARIDIIKEGIIQRFEFTHKLNSPDLEEHILRVGKVFYKKQQIIVEKCLNLLLKRIPSKKL